MVVVHGASEGLRYDFMMSSDISSSSCDVAIMKQQLDLLKAADPFNVVEMAIEIQNERKKTSDALNARDVAVQRLADAYISVRQKTSLVDRLQKELESSSRHGEYDLGRRNGENAESTKLKQEVAALEGVVKSLRDEIKALKEASSESKSQKEEVSPPRYESRLFKDQSAMKPHLIPPVNPFVLHRTTPPVISRVSSRNSLRSVPSTDSYAKTVLELEDNDLGLTIVRTAVHSDEAEDTINARNKLLASIALPEDAPQDALKPIMIPPPYTLHEFLATATGLLRNMLSSYRALQQPTTSWCPQREEHGYYLTPAFKCSTNPRVTTAHRWTPADVLSSKACKPLECFYNKDGIWYYAGVYKAFRLDDLTIKEWEALSNETTQALVKETLAGRKNTSPQNVYEVTQLYAAGALKVACVGLQCVGFNQAIYRAILEHVDNCTKTGKWKPAGYVGGINAGLGSGSLWNANNNNINNGNTLSDAVDDMAKLSIAAVAANRVIGEGSENLPQGVASGAKR